MIIRQENLDELDFCDNINVALKYENLYNEKKIDFRNQLEECIFLDALSTSFANVYQINNRIEYSITEDLNFYKPLSYSFKAFNIMSQMKVEINNIYFDELYDRLNINIGNYYSNQYRFCEAMEHYNFVLSHSNNEMALLSVCLCIESNPILLKIASKDKLINYLLDIYSNIIISSLDDADGKLNNFIQARIIFYKNMGFKRRYKKNDFIMMNGYFLNPLDELNIENVKDITPQNSLLKTLFSKYIFIRNDLFNFDLNPNKEILLLEIIFKELYSFFDKIAFFLNDFFSLKIPEQKINIKSIFKTNLLNFKNPYLYAIYWLIREYRKVNDSNININEYFPKAYTEIGNKRNELEHRIVEIPLEQLVEFRDVTLKLESIIRKCLIYLYLMELVELELRKSENKNREDSIFFAPNFMDFDLYLKK